MKLLVAAVALLAAGTARAETWAAAGLEAAAQEIAAAAAMLEDVAGAEDQVLALGAAITAFEGGLRALRDDMRMVALQEQALARDLQARQGEMSAVLGTLYTLQSQPAPLLFLHPGGPLAAAQSAQMLAEVAPAMQAEAVDLGAKISQIAGLRTLHDASAASLRDGLAGLLNARAALDDAIARGDPVPALFVEDRMQVQILAATSATLGDFAKALQSLPLPDLAATPISDSDAVLALPVAGTLLRGFNAAGEGEPARSGITVSAPALALVTAPFDATIRFAGPFLDHGNVVILEPRAGTLLILAGIGRLMRAEGDVLSKGDPLGQLGGRTLTDEEFLIEASAQSDVQPGQTLYIELRKDGVPVDPASMFQLD